MENLIDSKIEKMMEPLKGLMHTTLIIYIISIIIIVALLLLIINKLYKINKNK